ncbi:olfactory receptor 6C75-like [Alligator mississippiensis]|uniref:olfactory receptor 6C75-like n=1 Tax=Alligator mississippiensis TaxID=8496 RepID=UPI002877B84F|nr:olfactory receptor 6C75-like [Alligator mississippiensis]
MDNQTETEFILMGFTDVRWLQILLIFLLLCAYLLSLAGNLVIISITLVDHRLQTPMYFLLRNFSFLEIGVTSTTIPKVLFNLVSGTKSISVAGCFAQCLFYVIVGTTEFFLMAAISFDRYMAICKPLHYASIMNSQLCRQMVLGSWLLSSVYVISPFIIYFQLPLCGPYVIDHFFCDTVPLLKLACMDIQYLEILIFFLATGSIVGTFSITLISYVNIISTVLHLPSATGRQKAFSTCSSHLTVVSLSYGSCIFLYVTPQGSSRMDLSKGVALFNNAVSPLLNPFIYSLRNKQVKDAMRDAFRRTMMLARKTKL